MRPPTPSSRPECRPDARGTGTQACGQSSLAPLPRAPQKPPAHTGRLSVRRGARLCIHMSLLVGSFLIGKDPAPRGHTSEPGSESAHGGSVPLCRGHIVGLQCPCYADILVVVVHTEVKFRSRCASVWVSVLTRAC